MPGLLSTSIMDDAALLLNDATRITFTYTVQTPWLKRAINELSDELAVNNIPLLEKVSIITPTIIGSTTTIPLPADALIPVMLEERAFGSSDAWIKMDEVGSINPNYTQETGFRVWAFQGSLLNSSPVIDVPNASTAREVRVTYRRFVSTVGVDSSTDFTTSLTWQCKRFVSAKIAELITRFVLKDNKRVVELKSECSVAIYRLVQIWTKKRQGRPIRKSSFTGPSNFDYPIIGSSSGSSVPAPTPATGLYDYYVRDYGAVGDGFTDDYTAITATITAARATGGRVIFDPKTYLTSATIEVPATASNSKPVWLVGYGKNQNLQVAGEAGTTIKWIGITAAGIVVKFIARNCGGISDINVDCGITAGSVIVADYGFHFESIVGCYFSDLNVFRAAQYGYRIRANAAGVYSCTFDRLTTDVSVNGGMIIDSLNAANADCAHCTFNRLDLTYGGTNYGLDLASVDNAFFNGLTLLAEDNTSGHLMRLRDVNGVIDYGAQYNVFVQVDGGVMSGAPGPTIQADANFGNILFGFGNTNGFLASFVGAHPEKVILVGEVTGLTQAKYLQLQDGAAFGGLTDPTRFQMYYDTSSSKVRFQNHDPGATRRGWIWSGNAGAGAEVVAFEVNPDGELFERGRAVALGNFTTRAYNAAHYTASAGTWTTVAGTTIFKYSVIANRCRFQFSVIGSSVSNAGVVLQIALPFTPTNDMNMYFPLRVIDAGGGGLHGMGIIIAGSATLQLFTSWAGAGFAIAVANTQVHGGWEYEFTP